MTNNSNNDNRLGLMNCTNNRSTKSIMIEIKKYNI